MSSNINLQRASSLQETEEEFHSLLSYPLSFLFWILVLFYSVLSMFAASIIYLVKAVPKITLWLVVYGFLAFIGLMIIGVAISYIVVTILTINTNTF